MHVKQGVSRKKNALIKAVDRRKRRNMQCQYELIYEERAKNGFRRRWKPCQGVAGTSGYCELHKASADLLSAAKEAGYPDFTIATITDRGETKPCYTVSRGKLNWEGYARRHNKARHSDLMRRLRAMREMEKVA